MYRETFQGHHTGTTTAVSCAIFIMFFWFVKFVHVHFIWAPSRRNVSSGMVDLVCFKPDWSATKATVARIC